jgi:transcriptional regulator with XRE-family HTH domain
MELHGISGAELARRIDVSPAAVSRWLSGERTPDGPSLLKISRVLATDPWVLLGSTFIEPLPPKPTARRGRPSRVTAETMEATLPARRRKP